MSYTWERLCEIAEYEHNTLHEYVYRNVRTAEWHTLLHAAAACGRLDTVQYLINNEGVDVNQKSNNGDTALLKAEGNGHLDTVTYLEKVRGVDVNLRSQ